MAAAIALSKVIDEAGGEVVVFGTPAEEGGPNDPLTDKVYQYYIYEAPVFIKGQSQKLREFIKRYIQYGDNKENLNKIENGRILPSKSLQDSLNNMLKGNPEFVMIDDQKVVYEQAIYLAKEALRTDTKKILIVKVAQERGNLYSPLTCWLN